MSFEVGHQRFDRSVVPGAALVEEARATRVRERCSLGNVAVEALAAGVRHDLRLAVGIERKKAQAQFGRAALHIGIVELHVLVFQIVSPIRRVAAERKVLAGRRSVAVANLSTFLPTPRVSTYGRRKQAKMPNNFLKNLRLLQRKRLVPRWFAVSYLATPDLLEISRATVNTQALSQRSVRHILRLSTTMEASRK